MKTFIFKKLTFFLLSSLFMSESFSAFVEQTPSEDYLRLSLHATRAEHLIVKRKGNFVEIKTLDVDLFEKISSDFKKMALNKKYFSGVVIKNAQESSNVPSIELELTKNNVELFSFYKDREKRKVLDFWIDADTVSSKKSAVQSIPKKIEITKNKKVQKVKKLVKKSTPKKVVKKIAKKERDYKDFRYGAPFIWNYRALSPRIARPLDIHRKTPEYFYPIKNRDFKKSEKEAHLQLAINLYRKKKWGLMYKSLRLFSQKYGENEEVDFIEYLKGNAFVREKLENGKSDPAMVGIAMFQNIANRTSNYELKKGVSKYLITYYLENKELVQALDLSKKLYVDSKENFDYEVSDNAAEFILYSLAQLNQADKVRQLVKEKTIIKLLPKQTLIAYEMFSLLRLRKIEEVIRYYNEVKSSLAGPVHEAILFNVAEAMFRDSKYKESAKLFDEFLAQHSYHSRSSQARLRIALIYDLLDKDEKKVERMYKEAINRSQDPDVLFEAKVRYVAHRSVRKKNINDFDREVRVFLDHDNISKLSDDLKRLLWIVRLRTFIKDGQYQQALSFLAAIPLKTMKEELKRVFEGDGAEVVYGIMNDNFNKAEYAKVFKLWEIYKDVYVRKVASDPYLNFIVAKSLIKLNFDDQLNNFFKRLNKLKNTHSRTFPIWIERDKVLSFDLVSKELELLKLVKVKNWEKASEVIQKLSKTKFPKIDYYRGLIQYHIKDFKNAEKSFESHLVRKKRSENLDTIEVAKLLKAYTDSIYEQKKYTKFVRVVRALLDDTTALKGTNKYIQSVRERMNYLLIESTGAEKEPEFVTFSKDITSFKKSYPQSQYIGRINYLLGTGLVREKKFKEGREVFDEILKDSKSNEYLKEMVRTELSLLTIKERKI